MSSTPALLDPADLARQRDEDAQYYRQVLHKLIAMGTDLAEAVHRQALAEPAAPQNQPEDQPAAPSPSPSQATTFDRLARAVRRTIALARKLSEPVREAPGPKLRLQECPKDRRPDCAETDAPNAEPWAEPCERPEGPDCDADEDLDDDLDEQSLADLIASLRHDSGLAHLTDAELRQHRTPPSAQESAQEGVPSETCGLCAHREAIPRMGSVRQSRPTPRSGCKAAAQPRTVHPTTGDPRPPAPPRPTRPGTGPPRP